MEDLRVSLVQCNLLWEQPEGNLAMIEEMIWNEEQTDLIILPEMFTTGFSMEPSKLAEPVGGRTFKWMRQMAAQKNAAIVGSYIVKEGAKFFNRLYFVKPDGQSFFYDKKHLFTLAGENKNYTAGEDRLIVEYKGWKIFTLICYDLRFPVWSRSRSSTDNLYEFDLILYAANWPKPRINAWDSLLQSRAIENISYSIGVNRVGKDASGHEYSGHSAAYGYDGIQRAFSIKDEVIHCILNGKDLEKFRSKFPFQADADDFEIK